jgi:predicted peptidase
MNRQRTFSFAASLALTALIGSLALPAAGDVATGFIQGKVEAGGTAMRYVVYVPRSFAPDKPWPVILFLHGAAAAGPDGLRSVVGGLGWSLWQSPGRFPCLMVFPQQAVAAPWSGIANDLALQALEAVVQKYNGDRSRLYLTGISSGGDGTWTLAAAHPELFAAAVPIAGSGDPAKLAPALKSLPIWAFHGAEDKVVSPRRAQALVAAIQAAGNPNIQYTEYPDNGHNIWQLVYGDAKVIEWLLAQKR